MVFAYPLVGQTVQIRNLTEEVVENLYYTFEGYPETRIKRIEKNESEKFLIITSHLSNNLDLVFYFRNNPEKRFVFKNAVKAKDEKEPYTYFFGKVIKINKELMVVEDLEGKDIYFKEE